MPSTVISGARRLWHEFGIVTDSLSWVSGADRLVRKLGDKLFPLLLGDGSDNATEVVGDPVCVEVPQSHGAIGAGGGEDVAIPKRRSVDAVSMAGQRGDGAELAVIICAPQLGRRVVIAGGGQDAAIGAQCHRIRVLSRGQGRADAVAGSYFPLLHGAINAGGHQTITLRVERHFLDAVGAVTQLGDEMPAGYVPQFDGAIVAKGSHKVAVPAEHHLAGVVVLG